MRAYSKNPVGAHYGIGDWLLQRLTAVLMAVYTVYAFCLVAWRAPASQPEWKALLAGGFFRLFTVLFLAALLYHAWIGMRDILMDYVRATGLRLALQSAVVLVLAAYLVWGAALLWGVARP